MEVAKVVSIEDSSVKSGTNKKGQPWSQAKVALDNGKTAFVFNPVGVGDVLESYENNGYTNWRKAKEGAYAPQTAPQPAQAPVASDELLTLVKDNNRMLKALVGETESTNETGDDLPPAEAYDEPDFGG